MTRDGKTERLFVRMTPAMLNLIERISEEEDRSKTGLLRLALKEYIKNHYPEYKEEIK